MEPIYIPRAFNTRTCINRLWWWAGWPILLCRPTQEPALARENTRTARKKFWKNEGEWTWKVGISNKFLTVGVVCMALYTDLLSASKGEPLSSAFSTDGFQFLRPQYPTITSIDRLTVTTAWQTDCENWLTDRLTDCDQLMTDKLTDCDNWLTVRLTVTTGWLADRSTVTTDWLTDRLTDWLADWLTDWH